MAKQKRMILPVVSLGSEYLVIGNLMRRNIMTYKAPPGNEGYDLICIHPDPKKNKKPVRVQVKSRYATDAYRTVPLNEKSLEAFDFLIMAFLNIGKFFGKNDGTNGEEKAQFYTFPREFILKHHEKTSKWQQVNLRKLEFDEIELYRDEKGYEQIAEALGIPKPQKRLG